MPIYLSDLYPYHPTRTVRSLDTSLLTVPRVCLETFGRKSFSVFSPTVWNTLPLSLRKTQYFSTSKQKNKTNKQKKSKISSVWKASLLMFASLCFRLCHSAGVCVGGGGGGGGGSGKNGTGKNGTGENGTGKNGTRRKWLPELTAPEKMAPGNNGRVPNLESAVCTRGKKKARENKSAADSIVTRSASDCGSVYMHGIIV